MVKIIKVIFIGTQGTNELYKGVGSSKLYVRQQTKDSNRVIWSTATTWQGGYEPDAPIQTGITMQVVSRLGLKRIVHFAETMAADETGFVSAEKMELFSEEQIAKAIKDYATQKGLHSYEDWKLWLQKEADRCDYAGYLDNWMYFATEELYRKKIQTLSVLGIPYSLEESEWRHRFCGKTWKLVELKDSKGLVVALCGYAFTP